MPVEIRELIIRTNIVSDSHQKHDALDRQSTKNLKQFKKDILNECKKMINNKIKDQGER